MPPGLCAVVGVLEVAVPRFATWGLADLPPQPPRTAESESTRSAAAMRAGLCGMSFDIAVQGYRGRGYDVGTRVVISL
jgi:hypothetical protein